MEKDGRRTMKNKRRAIIPPATHLSTFGRVWAVNLGGFLVPTASHVAVSARHFGFGRIVLESGVVL